MSTDSSRAVLNVLTYNVMEPVPEPIRYYGQKERTERVKLVLSELDAEYDLDVVILNEVVALPAQKVIFQDMHDLGFVYRTTKLSNTLSVTGGVLIFSKHPLTQEESTTFGDSCTGIDCFCAKGVVYARVNKNGLYYNIMGTHMQAWPSVHAQLVRDAQIEQIAKFVHTINIPKNEPLLFCGDLNIDLFVNNDHIRHLMHRLSMDMPEIHPDSHPFTVDPQENKMVGNDDPDEYQNEAWPNGCVSEYYETLKCPCCPSEWIDYTLYSKRHLRPVISYMKSIKAKVPPFKMKVNRFKEVDDMEDVSDHFPTLGHFVFEVSSTRKKEARDTLLRDRKQINNNTSHIASVIVVLVLASVVILFFLGWAWVVWRQNRRNVQSQVSKV